MSIPPEIELPPDPAVDPDLRPTVEPDSGPPLSPPVDQGVGPAVGPLLAPIFGPTIGAAIPPDLRIDPSGNGINDNIGEEFIKKLRGNAREDRLRRLRQSLDQPDADPSAAEVPPDPSVSEVAGEGEGGGPIDLAARTLKDIALSTPELVPQAVGGLIDASKTTSEFFTEIAFPAGGVGPSLDAIMALPEEERAKFLPLAMQIPDIAEAETGTGSMVRSVSRFLGAFVGAGKFKAAQRLAALGRSGQISAAAAKGAVADFMAMDPQMERLSNLVEEHTGLLAPITDVLAARPDDTDLEGRWKNAVEGLGLGLLADGLFVVTKGLARWMRAKKDLGITDEATEAYFGTARDQRELAERAMGSIDPEAPLFRVVDAPTAPKFPGPIDRPPGRGIDEPIRIGRDDAGRIEINFNRINTEEDVKKIIQGMADSFAPGITKARRGRRTWQATILDGEKLDAWELINARRVGEVFNAEQMTAVREFWVQSGNNLMSMARNLRASGSDIDRVLFRRMLAVHNVIQEQVLAAGTEAARTLNAMKIMAGDNAVFKAQMDELTSAVRNDKSLDQTAELLALMGDGGNLKEADAFAFAAGRTTLPEVIRQYWYASMLSSFKTDGRNIIGSMGSLATQMTERKVANLIGKVFGRENVVGGESAAQWFAIMNSFPRSLRFGSKGRKLFFQANRMRARGNPEAAEALLEQNPGVLGTAFEALATGRRINPGATKLDVPRETALKPSRIRPKRSSMLGRVIESTGSGTLGPEAVGRVPQRIALDKDSKLGLFFAYADSWTTAPVRILNATDEIFKSGARDAENHALALRKAKGELDSGQITKAQLPDRIAALISDPDKFTKLDIDEFANVTTFTNQPLDTATWQAMQKVSRIPVIGRWLNPFLRTGYNLSTFTFRRTAIAPFMKSWQADWKAGGARRDLAMAQMAVGQGIQLSLAGMAMRGQITGKGPVNLAERKQLERSGWKPEAVRVPSGVDENGREVFRYFQIRGLDPISAHVINTANISEILTRDIVGEEDMDLEELVMVNAVDIASRVAFRPMMSGWTNFFDVMSDSQRYGESFWTRVPLSFVPRIVTDVTTAIDPERKEVSNFIAEMQAITPGLSKSVPRRRNLWGDVVSYRSGLGSVYDAISPIYSSTTAWTEPIDIELNRLESYNGPPPRTLNVDGAQINLRNRPKVYERYLLLSGNLLTKDRLGVNIDLNTGLGLKDTLNALVGGTHPRSGLYRQMTDGPDGGKANEIDRIIDDFQQAAKAQILFEFPEIAAELDRRRVPRRQEFKSMEKQMRGLQLR